MKYYKIKVINKDKWTRWLCPSRNWDNGMFYLGRESCAYIISEKALGRDLLWNFIDKYDYELKEIDISQCSHSGLIIENPDDFGRNLDFILGEVDGHYKIWLPILDTPFSLNYLSFNGKCFYYTNEADATIYSYEEINSGLIKCYLSKIKRPFLISVKID